MVPIQDQYPSTVLLILPTQDHAGVSDFWRYQHGASVSLILADFWQVVRQRKQEGVEVKCHQRKKEAIEVWCRCKISRYWQCCCYFQGKVHKQASEGIYGDNTITQKSDLGVIGDPNEWSHSWETSKRRKKPKNNNRQRWRCDQAIVLEYKQTRREKMTRKINESSKTKQKIINDIQFWTPNVKYLNKI